MFYIKSVHIGIISLSSLVRSLRLERFFNHSYATGFDISDREAQTVPNRSHPIMVSKN
ncbi:hypothetical protein F7734_20125 [Scytonema sp. UIC 10036]|uniref:hypothetical protein n=1 Tax=Scytonema sp. UIC 10036 TaxID=2304196 RepID=UPI0012DA5109|nr:hypothetical protein [Scytonema sp. UIC 10036]MUG94558.1 hypothetical protein [Scytonema sp. UIC 10036]